VVSLCCVKLTGARVGETNLAGGRELEQGWPADGQLLDSRLGLLGRRLAGRLGQEGGITVGEEEEMSRAGSEACSQVVGLLVRVIAAARRGVDQQHAPPAPSPPASEQDVRVVLERILKIAEPVVGGLEALIVGRKGRPTLVLGDHLVEVVQLEVVEPRRRRRRLGPLRPAGAGRHWAGTEDGEA
jgi:hypothetical protein